MTVLIAVQSENGAVLFTDSLHEKRCNIQEKEQRIKSAIHSSNSTDEKHSLSGIYFATTSKSPPMDMSNVHKETFSKSPNLAELLTHNLFMNPPINHPGSSIDMFKQQLQKFPQDLREKYEFVRSFVNSSSQTQGYDMCVLRILQNFVPDIVKISESKVTVEPYIVMEQGYEIKEYLRKMLPETSSLPTDNQALEIAVKAMNYALDKSCLHSGYQLVAAKRVNGALNLLTGRDDTAQRVDLDTIINLGLRFEDLTLPKFYTYLKSNQKELVSQSQYLIGNN